MSTAAEPAAEDSTNQAADDSSAASAAPLLPVELLTSVVEFSTFAEVHEAPRCVSREWRAAVRHATTHGRWKPVKYVADQGEALCRGGAVPAASCDIFRAAWAADPDEAFRLCLTWTVDEHPEEIDDCGYPKLVFMPERAARFLAVVERRATDSDASRRCANARTASPTPGEGWRRPCRGTCIITSRMPSKIYLTSPSKIPRKVLYLRGRGEFGSI